MSLTGALNAAVTGLRAQSQGLGIISDNIANAATIGYKSTSSNFASLVTQPPTGTSYTPGGVLPHPFTNVAAQGILQSTNSNTDVGITGAGFFAVTNSIDSVSAKAAGEIGFTRAGSFTLDKSGYLVNNSGQYLLGYPITQSTSAGSLASATAIGLGKITGSAQATTNLTIGANLPGVASQNTPLTLYGSIQLNPATGVGAPAAGLAYQKPNVVIYSSNGNAYSVTVSVTKLVPNSSPPGTASNEVASQVFLSNVTPLNGSPALGPTSGQATANSATLFSSLTAAQATAIGAVPNPNPATVAGVAAAANAAATAASLLAGATPSSVLTAYINQLPAGTQLTSALSNTVTTAATPALAATAAAAISTSIAAAGATGVVGATTTYNLGAGGAPGPFFNLGSISTNSTGVGFTQNSGAAPSFIGVGSVTSQLQPVIDVDNVIATGTQTVGLAVDEHDVQAVIYDSLGVGHNLTLGFVRNQTAVFAGTGNTVGNRSGWDVLVKSITVAKTGAPSATAVIGSGGSTTTPVFPMYIDGTPFTAATDAGGSTHGSGFSFNGDGSVAPGAPNQLPAFQLITGANTLGGQNGFTLNLGTPNSTSGLSGFDETFGLSFIKQDGIRYGTRTGISIANDGIVSALFNNGQTTQLFRLPLATFANPNALTPTTGSEYLVSDNSGDPTLNFPTQGSAGSLQSSALESSTVDIATEFTTMIVVQRNYEANTKIISTADQMMQQLLNIK